MDCGSTGMICVFVCAGDVELTVVHCEKRTKNKKVDNLNEFIALFYFEMSSAGAYLAKEL